VRIQRIKYEIISIYKNPHKKPSNVAKEHPNLYQKARKVFGSWKNAMEACGINYEEARNHNKWSRDKVLQEVKHLYSNGHSLRPKDFRKKGMVKLVSAATYHFGSWRKAVESSGAGYPCARAKKEKQTKVSTSSAIRRKNTTKP
jgi:hypothetical protein